MLQRRRQLHAWANQQAAIPSNERQLAQRSQRVQAGGQLQAAIAVDFQPLQVGHRSQQVAAQLQHHALCHQVEVLHVLPMPLQPR